MKEYIERETVLDRLAKVDMDTYYGFTAAVQFGVDHAIQCIKEAPAADVVEVRHGRWNPEIHHTYIPVEYGQNGDPILHEYTSFRCSLCGREELKEEPYCHCGARMDKEDEHEAD